MSTLAQYRQAYASGVTDPVRVAEAFLAADPVGGELQAFIDANPDQVLTEAADSHQRLQAGQPRGPLEGILVGVKDFFDVQGYETRLGTASLAEMADADDPLVARLRAAGAVIAGKTRGTELGLSPIGVNPAGGTPRNPHSAACITGGSSSGSAVAVAAGLVPLAVGSDGGGSLRIPPALTGVYGLKPSFGRIPGTQGLTAGWWSLDHPGPIAANAADQAEGYAVMAAVAEPDLTGGDDLRVGVDWSWWGEPDVAVDDACRAVVTELEPVTVTIEHLHLARIAEYVTIAAEVAAATYDTYREDPNAFSPDVRLILQLSEEFTATDYVRAQQVRTLLARSFEEAFSTTDVLVTPMTACAAPEISESARQVGFLDEQLLREVTAYAFPANLTGLPALTVPVGTDERGLPVGLQVVGPPGGEDRILRFAAHLDRLGRTPALRPAHHHDFLDQISA